MNLSGINTSPKGCSGGDTCNIPSTDRQAPNPGSSFETQTRRQAMKEWGQGAKHAPFPSYWQHITTEKSPTADLPFIDIRGSIRKISEKTINMSDFPDGNESTKTSWELLWLRAAHTETPVNFPKPPSTQALLLLSFPLMQKLKISLAACSNCNSIFLMHRKESQLFSWNHLSY